jgi:Ca2+/Na+ antiporter
MEFALIAADLVAVTVLVFGVYLPRYGRKDLVVAFFALNIGTLAVATTLASNTVSAGLGLGLFGVLSIVRVRSDELGQEDVAFYFSALSIGLLGGLQPDPTWLGPALMTLIVFGRYRHLELTLDRAFADEASART